MAEIPRQSSLGPFPLSFAQERFWFLQQVAPQRPNFFNRAQAVRLRGRLDVAALKQSLQHIVQRHAPLRSRIGMVEDRLVQTVRQDVDFRLPVQQLPATTQASQAALLQEEIAAAAGLTFDLGRDIFLRARLWRLDEREHVLLLVSHHIAADAWSDALFWQELGQLYTAYARGEKPELPELPIEYKDYAVWQREQLVHSPAVARDLAYWKQQLAGLEDLELPADRPRPALRLYGGEQVERRLAPDLLRDLEALAQQEGATLFMLLLAALQALLHRYNHQHDIAVGGPISGRFHPATEPLIGCFINNLVLRTDLSGNPTFRQLLARVRQVALQAYDHQQLPFEQLLLELRPERDTSRSPLFQVALNMLTPPFPRPRLPGLQVDSIPLAQQQAHFDLTFEIGYGAAEPDSRGLSIALVYNTDLFSRAAAQAILAQLVQLLAQVATAPDRAIASCTLVTVGQRAVLPDPRQELAPPYYEPVTSQIDAWAERTPEAAAIEWQEQSWSYRQLVASARQLAQVLLTARLGQGDVVALTGRRSYGLIAAMLGIFYCRTVLMIVDPDLPAGRQRLMLQAARARCLLYVGQRRPESVWLDNLLPVIGVNAQTGQAERPAGVTSPTEGVAPNDPAYIFFTSGSTGVPKGILGAHRSISHVVAWQRQRFAVGPGDRWAQLSAPSFDEILRDVYAPLTSGATLLLPADEAMATGQVLAWLRRKRVTILNTVPSVAQRWLRAEPEPPALAQPCALRLALFGGEALTDGFVKQWREVCGPAAQIVNLYGPTETGISASYYEVPAKPMPGVQPIGRPLPETQVLILSRGQLAGVGEVGEIVVRTPFLTLGYINDPERMKEQFNANPFRNDANDTLYHSGDLGRYRPDGSIQLLGRLDEQLKVNGVRIEPGEIEGVLEQHPAVWSSLVVAAAVQEQKRLVAYVATRAAIGVDGLRRHCSSRLPFYMIPAHFVILNELPLLANGKVDRSALPEPVVVQPDGTSDASPSSVAEKKIAAIWADVLSLPQIGTADNFFDLGGHSLQATQVLGRIASEFGIWIAVSLFYEHATLAELARHVEGAAATPARERRAGTI